MKRIFHKHKHKRLIRSALLTLGMAAVGFFYEQFRVCTSGTCAAVPGAMGIMLCAGIAGLLLSLFTGKEEKECNT